MNLFHLLLVDDEPHILDGLCYNIDWKELSISEVYTAGSTDAALEILQNHRVDVVITDIQMHGDDGLILDRVAPWENEAFLEKYKLNIRRNDVGFWVMLRVEQPKEALPQEEELHLAALDLCRNILAEDSRVIDYLNAQGVHAFLFLQQDSPEMHSSFHRAPGDISLSSGGPHQQSHPRLLELSAFSRGAGRHLPGAEPEHTALSGQFAQRHMQLRDGVGSRG